MVVSRQFGVAPDMRRLAEKHGKTFFQGMMKIGDPTLVLFAQNFIVQVRIADKGVAFKIHCHPFAFGQSGEYRFTSTALKQSEPIQFIRDFIDLAGKNFIRMANWPAFSL
jgi:hypothetical protein